MKKKIQKPANKKKINKVKKTEVIKKNPVIKEEKDIVIEKEIEIKETKSENTYPIQPLYDRILIKEDIESKEKTTSSGIIIPVTVDQDKNGKRGVVIAVGKGRYEDGKLIPVSVKVNDKVLFQWGDKITVDGTEYYIVRETELLAIIK
jgi:chaperonin GroES